MLVFSQIFHLLHEFTFPMFWKLYGLIQILMFSELHGFLFHAKQRSAPICKKYFGIFVFFLSFPVQSKFTVPMFCVLGIVWISASRKICKKHLNVLFSHTFAVLRKSLYPYFGGNTTDMETNEKFLFLIPFPHKRLCKTLY